MRTPVPSKAEGFSLKDDCTLSGRRLHRDERSAQPVRGTGEHCSRVEGGGYVDLAGGALVRAHGVVVVRAEGMKAGEKEVRCGANVEEDWLRSSGAELEITGC